MTPEYASPEQVRGEPVTTASDVYSLGVSLYELLTGHRPYGVMGRPPAAVERAICQEAPEKPSSAMGRPHKLRQRLAGDLDNIVLMAMRQEPQRRYSSVEQFSEDIRRHLEGLPVIARPDTPGYRASKFVARHKAGVAAAALIFLTLAAGIVATLWQERVAAAERDRARIQSAKAERINAFLRDMLSYSSPGWASPNLRKDPEVRVSQVVEEAARRAETELAGQPEVLADVERTLGNVYGGQGRWNQAKPLCELLSKGRSGFTAPITASPPEPRTIWPWCWCERATSPRRKRSFARPLMFTATRSKADIPMSPTWPARLATLERP